MKKILFVGAGVLTLIMSTGTGLYIQAHKHPSLPPTTVTAKPVQASPEFDYSSSRYGQVINKAQDYLTQNIQTVRPNERLILNYLQRKYGLNKQLSAQYNPVKAPVPGQQEGEEEFKTFERIVYPSKKVTALPKTDDPMSQMMMQAMVCDYISLPADYKKLMQTNIDMGGYNLTHVEFSLARIHENSCNYFTDTELQMLKSTVAQGMAKLATEPTTPADLRYEAQAFLLDMDRRDLVQANLIDQLIVDQTPDGSWPSLPNQPTVNDHPTVLALWAILAYARPDAPDEPMIHRPPVD